MQVRLIDRKPIAESTTEITVAMPVGFSFTPGQHTEFRIQNEMRTFSIVSAPHENLLSFVFRNSPSNFKKTLLALPLGSELTMEGPFGIFTLPRKTNRPIMAIAGGVGIAPFMSMIRHATEKQTNHIISVLYENSSPERAAYLPELRTSGAKLIEQYEHIPHEIFQSIVEKHQNTLYYLAGPPGMVARVHGSLRNLGADELSILIEEFTGY